MASATTTVAAAAPPAPVAGPRDPPAAPRGAVPRAREGGGVRRLPFPPAGPQPDPDSSTVPKGQGPRQPGHAAPLQAGRPLQAARHGRPAMTKAPPGPPAETDQPAPDSSTALKGPGPRRPVHAAPLQAARHGRPAMTKAPPARPAMTKAPPGRPAATDQPAPDSSTVPKGQGLRRPGHAAHLPQAGRHGRPAMAKAPPGPPGLLVRMTAGRRSPADAAAAPARLRPGGRNGIRELLRSLKSR